MPRKYSEPGAAGSLDRQRERVEQFIKANYPGEKYVVFHEQASGLNSERKQLNRLIDLALAGRIARVVIEWQDRLSRGSYVLIARLLEKCGVEVVITRTGEKENDAKSAEEEVLHDAMSMIYCMQARACGRRAAIKQTLVPPSGFKEHVARLAGRGLSRVEIVAQIEREKQWVCTNTGKPLGVRSVRLVLESLPASETVPRCVRTFVQTCCVVGAAKRETSAALYAAYLDHCQRGDLAPLNRDRWTQYLKQNCRHIRLVNERDHDRLWNRLETSVTLRIPQGWHTRPVSINSLRAAFFAPLRECDT